ncbi:MAG: hypothetical protein Q7O12_09680 [Deltaproteobacteria bacterium]|nr:hypothetical protein [Deltaproteobacteria bacterium]
MRIKLRLIRNGTKDIDEKSAGALAAGGLGWGLCGRWNIYAPAAVLGLAYAALAAGRWS